MTSSAMTDWNIANALRQTTARQPDQTALVSGKNGHYTFWSFRELLDATDRFAATLAAQKVERGQRVMLMVRPSPEFIALSFALFQLGAVVILIDPGMGYANLLRCIGAVKPRVLIAIPQVLTVSHFFRKPFRTVQHRFCVGGGPTMPWKNLSRLSQKHKANFTPVPAGRQDAAAIIFTTGSTGPPKGVCYNHGTFFSQLELIGDSFGIGPGDVDQPGFPLFALFSTALGASAVIPDMDPTRPAQVDPKKFVRSILDHRVTYSFGSPAIWKVVAGYCRSRGLTLPLKKILMAGAPVSGELVQQVREIMGPKGEVYTPYGATECLPVSAISGQEIIQETWPLTQQGRGTCVGRALPSMEIDIIAPEDGAIADWQRVTRLPRGEIGEIVVKGPVVTPGYDNNPQETQMAKIPDGPDIRHRMGDMGYLDEQGRLWFCGRKAHRVHTENGVMDTICCEAIFNQHPKVLRSALVGVGPRGSQLPVLIVELQEKGADTGQFFAQLRDLGRQYAHTRAITHFLVHPGFPVDIRHNAKIFREKLAVWAAKQLKGK